MAIPVAHKGRAIDRVVVPGKGNVALDCGKCRGRRFQVHVRPIVGTADAPIAELVCGNCGATYAVEYGLIGGKLDANTGTHGWARFADRRSGEAT